MDSTKMGVQRNKSQSVIFLKASETIKGNIHRESLIWRPRFSWHTSNRISTKCIFSKWLLSVKNIILHRNRHTHMQHIWGVEGLGYAVLSAHQSGTTAFALGSRLPTEMANKGTQLQSLSKVFVLLSIMTVKTNPLETGKEMEGQFPMYSVADSDTFFHYSDALPCARIYLLLLALSLCHWAFVNENSLSL